MKISTSCSKNPEISMDKRMRKNSW